MAKAFAIKRTKKFESFTVPAASLDTVLNELNEENGTVIAIILLTPSDEEAYRVVFFKTTTEQVEVDVPDDIEALDDQSDGVKTQ